MKSTHKLALGASVMTLIIGLAATAASTATAASSGGTAKTHTSTTQNTTIVGSYLWNADGYTGTLVIDSENQGAVTATLHDNGTTESLSGSWDGDHTLRLTRPIWGGSADQYYTYFIGGAPSQPTPVMFGGYFTQTNTGAFQYGTYLDSVR